MGANLQVFLIAEVPIPEGRSFYQCVGAFNHHYCFGIRAVRALYRFFSLLRVRENAALVRDELRSFAQWNLRGDAPLETWMNPAVPCPFAVSLLSIAWTTDLEHLPYLSNYSPSNGLLDARRDCWHRAGRGNDQEGICVIDISDVERPAYCFVRRPGAEVQTAWGFLREFYPSRFAVIPLKKKSQHIELDTAREHKRFMHALEAFWALVEVAGYPLVSRFAMLEAWPMSVEVRPGRRQIKVPTNDNLPMPLDIVVSLFLALADKAYPASFAQMFGVAAPHLAIGKAILPPYELGSAKDTLRRTMVIQAILAHRSPWEFIFEPPYLKASGRKGPPYMVAVDLERVQHWTGEYLRTVGPLTTCPLPPWTLEHLRTWGSRPAVRHLNSILSPGEFTVTNTKILLACISVQQITSCQRSELYDVLAALNVDPLWFGLQELGDLTFLDLSNAELTPTLLIELLSRAPQVECLSLSGNSKVRPEDLPAILTAAPSLRRLHVMHWTGQLFSDLQSVYSRFPEVFRRLEGVMCPPLLACNHLAPPSISFAFHHNTRVSTKSSPLVSVPFFSPSQVVQSLSYILPLAFQENRYGQSANLWLRDLMLATKTGPNSFANPAYGLPFYMASPMLIHAALSGATGRAGDSWNERRIVCVPTHGDAALSRVQDGGVWVFHFDWDHSRHRFRAPGRNQWGFVHYEVAERGAAPGDCEAEVDGCAEYHTSDTVSGAPRIAQICMFVPGPQDDLAHPIDSDHVVAAERASLMLRGPARYRAVIRLKPRQRLRQRQGSAPHVQPPTASSSTSTVADDVTTPKDLPTFGSLAEFIMDTLRTAADRQRAAGPSDITPFFPREALTEIISTDETPPQAMKAPSPAMAATASQSASASCSSEQENSRSGAAAPEPAEQEWLRFAGTVYDLRGFLRCMADEARELPDGEAIERLERILNTRDPVTSELVCELMAPGERLPLSGWRRSPTAAEREASFKKEYGGLDPDAYSWTPQLFPARVTRGQSGSGVEDSPSQNYAILMM